MFMIIYRSRPSKFQPCALLKATPTTKKPPPYFQDISSIKMMSTKQEVFDMIAAAPQAPRAIEQLVFLPKFASDGASLLPLHFSL
ncbi:hypothetical protein ACLOJK_024973 [Asimina triloba]